MCTSLSPTQHVRLVADLPASRNKDEIVLERLKPAALVVFGAPREKFSATEVCVGSRRPVGLHLCALYSRACARRQFEAIKTYVNEGGSALFMLGEGGESRYGTNINYLLEQFGIAVNSDSVVRTVYYKYLHPKEVFISNGILNKEIGAAASKLSGRSRSRCVWRGCECDWRHRVCSPSPRGCRCVCLAVDPTTWCLPRGCWRMMQRTTGAWLVRRGFVGRACSPPVVLGCSACAVAWTLCTLAARR